jgi:hypothetical protein
MVYANEKRLPAQTSLYSAEATAIYDVGKEKQMDWEKQLLRSKYHPGNPKQH